MQTGVMWEGLMLRIVSNACLFHSAYFVHAAAVHVTHGNLLWGSWLRTYNDEKCFSLILVYFADRLQIWAYHFIILIFTSSLF